MESNLTILTSNKHRYSVDLYFILYYLNTNVVINEEFLEFPNYNDVMSPSEYLTYVRNKLPSTLNPKTISLLNNLSNIYNKWFVEPSFYNLLFIQYNALYYERFYNNYELMDLYQNNINTIRGNLEISKKKHKLTHDLFMGIYTDFCDY